MALTTQDQIDAILGDIASGMITREAYDSHIATLASLGYAGTTPTFIPPAPEGNGVPGFVAPQAAGAAASTTTTTVARPKDTISFNFKDHAGTLNTKPFTRPSTGKTKAASFIKGGTPEEKKALARNIANRTTTGKSAADIAKINQARRWYTGQVKGASKGKKAPVVKGSVKWQLQHPNKKIAPGPGAPVVNREGRQGTGDVASSRSDVAGFVPGQTIPPPRPAPSPAATATASAVKLLIGGTPGVTDLERPATKSPRPRPRPPEYGGTLGANPESSTAGRVRAEVVKKSKDRFKGRKSRAATGDAALPGVYAPAGSTTFSDAAEARYNEKMKGRKAAKLLKKRQAEWKSTSRSGPRANPGGTTPLDTFAGAIDALLNPTPAQIAAKKAATIAATPGGQRSQVATFAAAKKSTAAKKEAAKVEKAKGFGYVAPRPAAKPKPKPRKKSSFGGGR